MPRLGRRQDCDYGGPQVPIFLRREPKQNPTTQPIVVSWGSVWELCCVVVFNSQRNKLLCRQNMKPIRNESRIEQGLTSAPT